MMARRLASIDDDEGLDDTDSDSDSVGSAWMDGAAGDWEDFEEGYAEMEGGSGEGDSDVDPGYTGWL